MDAGHEVDRERAFPRLWPVIWGQWACPLRIVVTWDVYVKWQLTGKAGRNWWKEEWSRPARGGMHAMP